MALKFVTAALQALILAFAASLLAGATAARSDTFTVGVLTFQGGDNGEWDLLPVGRFNGREWVNTWPKPIDEDTPFTVPPLERIPHAWLGGPVPRVWTVWTPDGRTRRVRITGVARSNGCVAPIVLRVPASATLHTSLIFDKVPVVEPVVDVQASGMEAHDIRSGLYDVFEFAEEEALARRNRDGELRYPLTLPSERRRDVSIELKRLFRPLRASDPAIYYVEALKRFAPTENAADLIVLAGWIRRVGGAVVGLDVEAGESWSAEDKGSHFIPLGIVRAAGRSFWISYVEQYEGQAVVVGDVSEHAIKKVLVVDGGGC